MGRANEHLGFHVVQAGGRAAGYRGGGGVCVAVWPGKTTDLINGRAPGRQRSATFNFNLPPPRTAISREQAIG